MKNEKQNKRSSSVYGCRDFSLIRKIQERTSSESKFDQGSESKKEKSASAIIRGNSRCLNRNSFLA